VVAAYRSEGTATQRFAAIDAVSGTRSDTLLSQCEAHIANTANTYLPFLWPCFKSHRATLFRLLHALDVTATTQDSGLESAIRFLLANEERTGEWLTTVETRVVGHGTVERTPLVDLTWVSESWWRLLSDVRPRPAYPRRIKRRAFEVCVFSQILWELKSGDLAVVGDGTITENDRDAQRKVIKYNHLVANCVIFYTVFAMSQVFHGLELAGEAIEDAALAALSPYITAHINRLGRYELDARRRAPVLDYTLFARPVPARQPRPPVAAVA